MLHNLLQKGRPFHNDYVTKCELAGQLVAAPVPMCTKQSITTDEAVIILPGTLL